MRRGLLRFITLPKSTPVKKFIGELISCYWCTGVWVSTGVVLGFLYFSTLLCSLFICAIAGLASILESLLQLWIDNIA